MSATSSPASSERSLHQKLLSIHFLIIGGGAAGLCSAITLSRTGHKVTLIEASESMDKSPLSAGSILPPDVVKLLTRWGIDRGLRDMSHKTTGFKLSRYETTEPLGHHIWEDDFLRETGGEIRTTNYCAFRKLLKDAASQNGAVMRIGDRVKSVEPRANMRPIVTLESGEFMEADVVIGADGTDSLVRKTIVGKDETSTYLGTDVFIVFIPGDKIVADSELKDLLDEELMLCTFGNGRANYAYRIPPPPGSPQQPSDYVLNLFLPGDGTQELWKPVAAAFVLERMGDCDIRTKKLVTIATVISGAPMIERPLLENWVHSDGRVLVIGDAAHLFYPSSIQNLGVAVCDAATLGHLFQNLHHHRQINVFLHAFQEIRPGRVQFMRTLEFSNLDFMMMPNGPAQEQRDQSLRERYKKGLNALDADGVLEDALGGANITTRWDIKRASYFSMAVANTRTSFAQAIVHTFGYDAEEEADKWWADWGSLQERASFSNIISDFVVEVQHVEQTVVGDLA